MKHRSRAPGASSVRSVGIGPCVPLRPCNTVRVLQVMVACPDCPAARDARAMFLDVDLLFNLVVALLPFAVWIAVALIVVQLGGRRRIP